MQKVLECSGDDMSCISGADSPSMTGGDRCDIGKQNVSCSSASISSSLPDGLEKRVDLQLTSCCQAGSLYEVKEGCNTSCRPTKFTKESLQETAPFSDKSESSEISCLRDVYTGARSLKGDLSECSREQEASSLASVPTITLDGFNHDALHIAEFNKPTTEVDEDDTATAATEYLDQNEDLESPEVSNVQGPPEQSHQTVKCTDDADLMEDVKVCDICGDVGRENFLAICSQCTDGAEHIYCMHVKLDKVPEGDWICEDCILQEETEKQKQNEFRKVVRMPEGLSSSKIDQNAGNSNANIRTCMELDTKGSDVEKSGRDKVGSIPRFCAKRPADNLETGSISKRRALETSVGLPTMSSPCRKALLSQVSPHKNLDNLKVKPTCDISTFGDRSFKSNQGNALSSTISCSNSHKSETSSQMLRGVLTKSNSFNISDSTMKVQAPSEDILEKHKFSGETAASDKGNDGIVRRMRKSLSFNNVSSGHSKAAVSKIKLLPSKFSHVTDLNRLIHAKEHNLSQRKYKAKFDKPLISSPMVGSCISGLRIGKKIACDGEILLPCSSGTKLNVKPPQSHGNSNISSNPSCPLPCEGSKYHTTDHAKSGVVKKLHSCLSNVFGDPSSLTKSDSSHELEQNIVAGRNRLGSNFSLTAGRHCNSSDATAHDILPQSQSSYSRDWKVQKTSYFSWAREHILPGNRSAYSHKCDNIGDAADSFPVMTPQTTVLDTGGSKEVNQSNNMMHNRDQPDASSISAIPKLDHIWKGEFEIQSSGRLPSFCNGIQAHLSTCTSPKVPEVVKKFPCKVLLEEVPRLSAWPTQFLENHPKEDNIGVYFFAEDLASYGGNYRNLMDCMINYDLALKGDVDGIDLLIFSSNLLPEKSQRWNKLFFLWGMFRGRRINNEEFMPCSLKKISIPGLTNVRSDQGLSISSINGFENMCSSGQSRECLSASRFLYNAQPSSSLINHQELPYVSSRRKDGNDEHKLPSAEQKYIHLATNFDQRPSPDDPISSCIPIHKQLYRDMQHTLTTLKEHRLPERRQEDHQPKRQASNYDMDSVIWGGGRAHSMEVADYSRSTYRSPFSADPVQVDGMLRVDSSEWLSSDCKEDHMEFEFLDLGLSLGIGKRYEKQALVPHFHRIVDERNNQDKNPSSIASNKNNDGAEAKFSASLELSLTLPFYDKCPCLEA